MSNKLYIIEHIFYRSTYLIKKQVLKSIRFHDLRHSCTTMMIEAGIDMKTVQTRIGHANITTTMNTYAHCTPAMDQSAADKLDNILFA